MEAYNEHIRQLEISGRIQFARSLNLSSQVADDLQAAEKFLNSQPCLPILSVAGITSIPPAADLQKLVQLQQCAEAAAHLQVICAHFPVERENLRMINTAYDVYAAAVEQLMHVLFPQDHHYWDRHYPIGLLNRKRRLMRSKESGHEIEASELPGSYPLLFVGAQVMFECMTGNHKTEEQLLLQSLQWAYYGYYFMLRQPPSLRRKIFENALQLVESVDVPAYRQWLLFCKDNPCLTIPEC